MNPLNEHSSTGSGDPKEKKIVNEQEQNKPVNAGDQPFEDEDTPNKENQKTGKNETAASIDDSITNKGDNEILNKDEDIKPD